MLKRLRIFLVCLLALALPVQGFAAATMLLCAGGHHHGPAALVALPASLGLGLHGQGLHHHPTGTAVHEHAGAHVHADSPGQDDHHGSLLSEVEQGRPHASDAAAHAHGKSLSKLDGKCSACAACCTSVALPTTLVAFQPVKAASPQVAVVPTSSVGFLTDGQDRPPRFFLA